MKSILESIIYGALAALLSLFIEAIVTITLLGNSEIFFTDSMTSFILSSSGIFLLVSAFTEELSKFIIVFKKIEPSHVSGRTIVFNSLVAGIGFALIEFIFLKSKFISFSMNEYLEIAGLFIFHSTTFSIIGYYSIVPKKVHSFIFKIIFPLSLIHFAFNLLAFFPEKYSSFTRMSIIFLLTLFAFKMLISTKSKLANS